MSKAERIDYKRTVMQDFIEHGMSEKEALVNYVFCINPDPLTWLEYRYSISKDDATSLKNEGLDKYRKNGGKHECRKVIPSSSKPTRSCKCNKPIVPQ